MFVVQDFGARRADFHGHLFQVGKRRSDRIAAFRRDEEQHEPSSASAQELAAAGARLASGAVNLIDDAVRDRGVETGLRQLRRTAPLETTTVATRWGAVRVPTPEELLRINCWLALTRNQTRDYLDIVALAQILGDTRSVAALTLFDELYRDLYRADTGRDVSPLLQLARQLADPNPEDRDWMDLGAYKNLRDPWRSWDCVRQACGRLSTDLIASRT